MHVLGCVEIFGITIGLSVTTNYDHMVKLGQYDRNTSETHEDIILQFVGVVPGTILGGGSSCLVPYILFHSGFPPADQIM